MCINFSEYLSNELHAWLVTIASQRSPTMYLNHNCVMMCLSIPNCITYFNAALCYVISAQINAKAD